MSRAAPQPPAKGLRTALVVVVPEAESLVEAFRARHLAEAVGRGVPPHVTVLSPFAPPGSLGAPMLTALRTFAGGEQAFDAELTRVASFPEHVWLAPSPRQRFVSLIRSTCERFPAYPPSGGNHDEPEPHLTVGQAETASGLAAITAAAERELAPGLPLRFRVTALTLLEEGSDGCWTERARFPFAPA